MIKAIIFDWNGTLIDDIRRHVKRYAQVLREAGAKDEGLEEFLKKHLGNISKSAFEKAAYEKTGIMFSKKMVKRKIGLYLKAAGSLQDSIFFPGMIEVVEYLKGKYKMSIVSGSEESQIIQMLPQQAKEAFTAIIGDNGRLKPKPAPDMLIFAAKMMGVKPADCAYVGDAEYDMTAARKAGMKAVGVTTGNFSAGDLRKAGAEFVVKSLREFIDILGEL